MDAIVVRGGRRLRGEVAVGGAKNASLPILFASLLTREDCWIENVPRVVDCATTERLLAGLGVDVEPNSFGNVALAAREITKLEAPYDLVKTMRASFLALGPLLARFGEARVATPGGCAIGSRPVNLHLQGLERMGAEIVTSHGYVEARAPRGRGGGPRLRGARIALDVPSVGATENLMMAAALARGTTVIENAAREPEIVDLAEVLRKMGARVEGAGSPTLEILGQSELGGFRHRVIPDRIEAGTLLMAVAAAGGEVLVRGAIAAHLVVVLEHLAETGVAIQELPDAIRIRRDERLRAVDVRTAPHPGFPTDLQAQMMALMCLAEGSSLITETIFENRFMHVQELVRMGADIRVEGATARVTGVEKLEGAPVMATDLRASVCLVVAALGASNTTHLSRVYHLDRGYERLEEKLSALGADVERVAEGRRAQRAEVRVLSPAEAASALIDGATTRARAGARPPADSRPEPTPPPRRRPSRRATPTS
jgi:UDP-N-acetylglucosamine 1-carboxyvinyltransferase